MCKRCAEQFNRVKAEMEYGAGAALDKAQKSFDSAAKVSINLQRFNATLDLSAKHPSKSFVFYSRKQGPARTMKISANVRRLAVHFETK